MEQFNAFWESIKPYVLSVTTSTAFTTIIMAVVTALIKSSINKKFDASTMTKLYDDSFNRVTDKMKGMAFTQNIEPLVNSRLKAIQEIAVEDIKSEVSELREMNKMQTKLIGALIGMFDNSMIPEDVKANAHNMLNEAMSMYEDVPKVEAVLEVKEEPKKKTNNIEIER